MGFSCSLDSARHKHVIVLVRINCSGFVSGVLLAGLVLKVVARELGNFNVITAHLEEPDM